VPAILSAHRVRLNIALVSRSAVRIIVRVQKLSYGCFVSIGASHLPPAPIRLSHKLIADRYSSHFVAPLRERTKPAARPVIHLGRKDGSPQGSQGTCITSHFCFTILGLNFPCLISPAESNA
jgi:hypothetical protein